MLASIVKANPAIRGCSRLEPKGQAVESGSSNVARRTHTQNCRCSRADLNPSCIECKTWKGCCSGPRDGWPPQPQGREAEAALRRPKKPRPVCNGPDMPTSARCRMARKHVEPLPTGKSK